MPTSSVPAAYDREHLYSPKEGTAELVDHRPGDAFTPLPTAPREPKAWGTWWRSEAPARKQPGRRRTSPGPPTPEAGPRSPDPCPAVPCTPAVPAKEST
ncbi:hypothetical protein ACIOTI_32570 [Streptomyces sp. NPDC087843]|uniref:hypothetical protein n=1 Tax=Streptomyces sp. NPDC087843 TaxID=3365804 RepID=UPI0038296938